jgi:hypothetical protein
MASINREVPACHAINLGAGQLRMIFEADKILASLSHKACVSHEKSRPPLDRRAAWGKISLWYRACQRRVT